MPARVGARWRHAAAVPAVAAAARALDERAWLDSLSSLDSVGSLRGLGGLDSVGGLGVRGGVPGQAGAGRSPGLRGTPLGGGCRGFAGGLSRLFG